MSDDEQTRRTSLIHDAFARGQDALEAGDKAEALRWLDRAHRLAPGDGTIALFLASASIGDDNAKAATLFAEVAAASDVWDAWLGLATTRFLMRDMAGATDALAQALSRHAARAGSADLAAQLVSATGAPGWCDLSSGGKVGVWSCQERAEVHIDGRPVGNGVLPTAWRRARQITVMTRGHHLIGSPLSPAAIARVEGHVEAWRGGLRGWTWHPGDPETDPRLTVSSGRDRKIIVASQAADAVPGLAPLARPRSFVIRRADLPAAGLPIHVRGRDGRDIPGSPLRAERDASVRPKLQAQPRPRPDARPCDDNRPTTILVTHADGGGVERRIQTAIASDNARGRRTLVLRPESRRRSTSITIDQASRPAALYALPKQRPALLKFLRGAKPVEAELHHFLNHDPSVFETVRALGVPYDVHVHDYIWFCPRIALVGRDDRYCGEPHPAGCETCVAEQGSYLREDISVSALLKRSGEILSGARRVVAPSQDTAAPKSRQFPGIAMTVVPHEDDAAIDDPPPIPLVKGTVRVCVGGAIGLHKGFDVLLACARDAETRDLELTFVVAGTTIDDRTLIDTDRVFVTGPYQPDEAVSLIRAQNATLALLPSIWPETWCLGLTELWRAGLRVAAFDIGAPADRIRDTGRGFLLPLDLSPSDINDALLNAARGRSFLPIRRSSAYKPSR